MEELIEELKGVHRSIDVLIGALEGNHVYPMLGTVKDAVCEMGYDRILVQLNSIFSDMICEHGDDILNIKNTLDETY